MAKAMRREALAAAQPIQTKGEALGELFQYVIQTPVTVGRGQSAMVPVVASMLEYRKDLLYNAAKLPGHPVATLRLRNTTGLTLERGPATIMESAGYLGEAVLPLTAAGGEIVLPYAVELGLKVREESGGRRIKRAIYIDHGQVQNTGTSGEIIDIYNQVLDRQRIEKMNRADGSADDIEGGVEVTKVETLGADGKPVREVYGDEPLEIRVKYTAYKDIGKSNALILIYRSDGLMCANMRSHLDGYPMTIEKGEGEYSVKLDPLQLFGGTYYAITWIMNADDSDGIAYGASEWFEVKNRVPGREAHIAVYEPNRAWVQNSHAVIPQSSRQA